MKNYSTTEIRLADFILGLSDEQIHWIRRLRRTDDATYRPFQVLQSAVTAQQLGIPEEIDQLLGRMAASHVQIQEDSDRKEKVADFLVGLTEAQVDWLREVRDFDPSEVEIGPRVWDLFGAANLHGMRRSVALLIVRRRARQQEWPIEDQKIIHQAAGAYGPRHSEENSPDSRPPCPKPNIYPGMVIPKVHPSVSARPKEGT